MLPPAAGARPLGPYEKLNDGPILTDIPDLPNPSFEDPFLWHDGELFHLLAKDMNGTTCGELDGGIHAFSEDCLHWHVTDPRLSYSRRITWDDGRTVMQGSFERPWLLIENGKPTHLFGSIADGPGGYWKSSHTWIAVLPIRE
jgi:hypothetical protein